MQHDWHRLAAQLLQRMALVASVRKYLPCKLTLVQIRDLTQVFLRQTNPQAQLASGCVDVHLRVTQLYLCHLAAVLHS